MSERAIPPELESQGYEVGQAVLRETILEAGGLEGIFRELREDLVGASGKYLMLLLSSITPEEIAAKTAAFEERGGESTIESRVRALAAANNIPAEHANAFYMAFGITYVAGLVEKKEKYGENNRN